MSARKGLHMYTVSHVPYDEWLQADGQTGERAEVIFTGPERTPPDFVTVTRKYELPPLAPGKYAQAIAFPEDPHVVFSSTAKVPEINRAARAAICQSLDEMDMADEAPVASARLKGPMWGHGQSNDVTTEE